MLSAVNPALLYTPLLAWLLALPWLNPFVYGPTLPMVQFLFTWMAAALCWLLCRVAGLDARARLQVVAGAWLLGAAVSAAMGLLQYLGYAEAFSPWVSYVEAGQAYANLRQRNQQATLVAIGLCALLWWQVQGTAGRVTEPKISAEGAEAGVLAQHLWPRIALMGVAVLLAAADAATGSRTGMLQLLLLLGLSFLWRRGSGMLWLVLGSYGLAAMFLPQFAGLDPLSSGILGRLGEPASPCGSRLVLWSNVMELIAERPWTGWGWGELAYAHFQHLYAGPRFCEIMGNAHNLPLHLAVELGLPLALLLCGGAIGLVLRARPWREQDPTRQMAWSVLLVIAAHSLLEYPLWYAPFQLAALLALALLWPASNGAASRSGLRRFLAAWPASSVSILACAVLLACSYAAWDYRRISQIYLAESARAPQYRAFTLEKIRGTWLFGRQVQFAELGITEVQPDNAAALYALALQMLHYSPESSVVGKLIASAALLDKKQEVLDMRQRFKAAYPDDYAAWARRFDSGLRDKAP